MPYDDVSSDSLPETGQGAAIGPARAFSISLRGTWTGTVTVQRKVPAGTWHDVKDASWTANVEALVGVGVVPELARISFTRTSGQLDYTIKAGEALP